MTQAAKQDLRNLKDFVNLKPERVIISEVKQSVATPRSIKTIRLSSNVTDCFAARAMTTCARAMKTLFH